MGYYTTFWMSHSKGDGKEVARLPEDVVDWLENKLDEHPDGFDAGLVKMGLDQDSIKWYDHDDDMLAMSKAFPQYLFILNGDGEESGDVWRTGYKDGSIVFHQELGGLPPVPRDALTFGGK